MNPDRVVEPTLQQWRVRIMTLDLTKLDTAWPFKDALAFRVMTKSQDEAEKIAAGVLTQWLHMHPGVAASYSVGGLSFAERGLD